jgi:hypothetical protein
MSNDHDTNMHRSVLATTTALHRDLLAIARQHADDQASSEHVLTLCGLLAGTVRDWLTGRPL